jgi:membrane protease YdiL (CAAX protease family)
MTARTLVAFFVITFTLAWGLLLLYVAVPQVQQAFGPLGYTNPLYFLIVWAPAFAGLGMVARHHGLRGLGSFLGRLTMWRMPVGWWAFLLLGLPVIFYVGAAIKGNFPAPFPFEPWYAAVPAIATALMLGPVEELGWRGYALPLLQRRYSPFVASLVLGAIWAVWHLPAFLTGGTPMSSFSFGTWSLGVMAITLVLTAMFNAARGSLLIAFLFHFMLMNPIFPDAQPWDSVMLAIVAVAVVAAKRDEMLAGGTGVTNVLMQPDETPTCERAPLPAGHADSTLASGHVAAARDG